MHAQEVTAGLRQNPSALISGQMFTLKPNNPNGTDFYQFGVDRLLELGGKRQARLDTARSTTTLTSFQIDDQRRQTDLAIRQTFSRMLYAQQALAISRENLENYRRTVALMKVRLDAGDIDQTDFYRVELQLAGFESDLDNAELTLRQGSIALQTLVGVAAPSDRFDIKGTLDPPMVSATIEELRKAALAHRPDLKAAEAQVDVNAAAIRLAVAGGTADPVLEGEYERAGNANTLGASINVPLRIFDRNQGEKQRAARYGILPADVNATIQAAVGGAPITQMVEGDRHFDITLRYPEEYRSNPESVGRILLQTPDGSQVPLSQVADVAIREGSFMIYREGGRRYIPIKFNVRGRDLAATIVDLQNQIRQKIKLPHGYTYAWAGEFDSLRKEHADNTAFQSAGAAWLLIRRRPSANWPLQMRRSSSMPAVVVAADVKFLKPSIGLVLDWMRDGLARRGCSSTWKTTALCVWAIDRRSTPRGQLDAKRHNRPE